jgi:hypothetical protein
MAKGVSNPRPRYSSWGMVNSYHDAAPRLEDAGKTEVLEAKERREVM